MRIVGIKVGTRSAVTAKRDGTVLWNPAVDIPPHNYTWSTGSRVQTNAALPSVELRSSTEISPATLLRTIVSTAYAGTVVTGPVYNVSNLNWWYQVNWDDETLGNSDSWVKATALEAAAPVGNATPTTAQSSVTYYGVTWTFSAPAQVGYFVTGEPFVVGPVTVTAISPTWNGKNGSMVNPLPGRDHGFDSTINNLYTNSYGTRNYSAVLNKALNLPLTLQNNDVLVSSKALNPEENPTKLDAVVALTVLASSPTVGSFRPPIWGTDRTVSWNESMINWGLLKNLTPPTNDDLPYSWIEYLTSALPWFEWTGHSDGNRLRPRQNFADGNREYGEQVAGKFGLLISWLNTNRPFSEKRTMALRLIQNGLDIKAYLDNGGDFYHDGGHNCGRKAPCVLAAALLQSAPLKSWLSAGSPSLFQEDQQTWIVTQGDTERVLPPLTGEWAGRPLAQYTSDLVGKGEWGLRHLHEPEQDNAHWGATYRSNNFNGMMACYFGIALMEQQAVWAWPAAFSYMERTYQINNAIYCSTHWMHSAFMQRLWTAYHTTP